MSRRCLLRFTCGLFQRGKFDTLTIFPSMYNKGGFGVIDRMLPDAGCLVVRCRLNRACQKGQGTHGKCKQSGNLFV